MRQILFRGQFQDNGKWVEGDLVQNRFVTCIVDVANDEIWSVNPSTVSQYTGLRDRAGTQIFEGDILEVYLDDYSPENVIRVSVEWHFSGWALNLGDGLPPEIIDEPDLNIWTVCGNIWDNPELISRKGGRSFAGRYRI